MSALLKITVFKILLVSLQTAFYRTTVKSSTFLPDSLQCIIFVFLGIIRVSGAKE